MTLLNKSVKYLQAHDKFVRNNPRRGKAVIRTLKKLSSDPTHPSLRIEKLSGTDDVWSARVDKKDRLFFIWANKDTIILLDIGPHDKYREY